MTAVLRCLGLQLRDGLVLLPLVVAAYALKRHYSVATVEELVFVLAPTVALVEAATGTPWPLETGVGYVSVAHATAIVPACAGINFMIAAVAALAVGFLGRFQGLPAKLYWALAAVVAGFLATVTVNAARILADIALRDLMLAANAHADLHRGLGVIVYFGAVSVLYACADRIMLRRSA